MIHIRQYIRQRNDFPWENRSDWWIARLRFLLHIWKLFFDQANKFKQLFLFWNSESIRKLIFWEILENQKFSKIGL